MSSGRIRRASNRCPAPQMLSSRYWPEVSSSAPRVSETVSRAIFSGFSSLLRSLLMRVLRIGNDQMNSRSEEHTSELQSRPHLVCRLLLEKKKDRKQVS